MFPVKDELFPGAQSDRQPEAEVQTSEVLQKLRSLASSSLSVCVSDTMPKTNASLVATC